MKQFDFGKNWISFSRHALTKERIELARKDFSSLLNGIPLAGRTFLDIGFGQGLSLLFAAKAGALVTGCDINSKCEEALAITAQAFGTSPSFPVIIGSILSEETVKQLGSSISNGTYDIVHSWGVLHHTGDMRRAISTACTLTARGGHLVLAIYNRHWTSPLWKLIKRLYCAVPVFLQRLFITAFIPVIFIAKYLVTGTNPLRQQRGMDFLYNVIDWVGGYPYEYASVEELKSMVENQGFSCCGVIPAEVPTGCNQFIFQKL